MPRSSPDSREVGEGREREGRGGWGELDTESVSALLSGVRAERS